MRCRLWLYMWLCLCRFIRAATSAVSTCNAAETASKEEVSPPQLGFAQKLRQLCDIGRNPPRLVFGEQLAADLIGLSWPFCYYRRKRRPTWEEGNGMVHAENIDSRCSSFQLDDCPRRDHRSLAHRSKFPLSGGRNASAAPHRTAHVGSIASAAWQYSPRSATPRRARCFAYADVCRARP
jgi:hypothetical protein